MGARAAVAFLLLLAACSHEYDVIVVAGSDDVLTAGVSWDLTVVREGCEAGATSGLPPTLDRVVRSLPWRLGQDGPSVGNLDPGRYGFYVRVRDESCTVRWAGCTDVRAEAGGAGTITIELAAVDGPGCDDSLECTGQESCDETGACQAIPGTVPDCADDDPCTIDVCEEPGGCRHLPGDRDADDDGFTCGEDCDDTRASVSPSATEQCNGRDDDCDDDVDEGNVCGGVDDDCFEQAIQATRYLACRREQSWTDGVDTCVRHQGILATAYVDEEAMALLDSAAAVLPPEWWIGVNDRAQEGRWDDASGTPMAYTQWAAGVPSGGVSSDCVLFSLPDHGWRDAPCTDLRPVVCELD